MIYTQNVKSNTIKLLAFITITNYFMRKDRESCLRSIRGTKNRNCRYSNTMKSCGRNTCEYIRSMSESDENTDSSIHDDGIYDVDMECLLKKMI